MKKLTIKKVFDVMDYWKLSNTNQFFYNLDVCYDNKDDEWFVKGMMSNSYYRYDDSINYLHYKLSNLEMNSQKSIKEKAKEIVENALDELYYKYSDDENFMKQYNKEYTK